MPIWDRLCECLPQNRLHALQLKRLRQAVAHCAEHSAFYAERLRGAGVDAAKLRAIEDLRRLPFTTPAELEDAYPQGLLCVPEDAVASAYAAATHRGGQCLAAYTRTDLVVWSDLTARLLAMAGVTPRSVVQLAFCRGVVPEAFGLQRGVEQIGARLIPASVGDKRREVELICDLNTTHLVCTPRYALEVIAAAKAMGVRLGRTRLRAGILGGENWDEHLRQRLESGLGVETYDHYGPGEILPAGIAAECPLRDGLHVFEDHFMVEVVDPESGAPMPDGAEGEVVVTSLTLEACPRLRYRTGNRAAITHHPCACGRTFARITRPTAPAGGPLLIHGASLLPAQIERVLANAAGHVPPYEVIHDCEHLAEDLELRIVVTEPLLSDEMRILRELETRVRDYFLRLLSLTVKVTFVEPGSRPRGRT